MNKIKLTLLLALVFGNVGSLMAQQTPHPKKGTIWLSWKEGGHYWMVGALKEFATANDDPGFVQTSFTKGYCVKVQGEGDTGDGVLFHNCCITNIVLGTNYTGTVTVGTNVLSMTNLLKLIRK